MQKSTFSLISLLLLTTISLMAQNEYRLSLPNHELLSSEKVLHVMQDSEGFLWYATDGGGLCRDDGRQVDVFRNDAEHPDLLGSNTVVCLAEAEPFIIIGTSHGANVLDKTDYSIRSLKEVDDKRVDDIIVTANGHWWLTANKKVYEYTADGRLLRILDAGDKYIFHLHEDEKNRLWCRQWEGGILRLDRDSFVQVALEWPDSIDFRRITTDGQGNQLVSDGLGACYALTKNREVQWFKGTILSKEQANDIKVSLNLSARPTAVARSNEGECWFSTGKDIRCKTNGEETVVSNTKDVSAMAFTPDGTLWMATIYGQLYHYRNGNIETDDYGSNEYGDGVVAMTVDSLGRLVLVSDRYTRIYDTHRHTLRQQSREADGTYMIELQETAPGERWSQPTRDKIVELEHTPAWIWWMLALLLLVMLALLGYVLMLRRQRRRFLSAMKSLTPNPSRGGEGSIYLQDGIAAEKVITPLSPARGVGGEAVGGDSSWLQKAIAQVEAHLSDEGYTVEQLSNDMCMSRMTFYRKIQSATGHTPTEFMRTIRLRRAAEMLREGRNTVTEIAYATGFSSVSYFSRCFRTMYGVPPTQFGNITTADDLAPKEMPS